MTLKWHTCNPDSHAKMNLEDTKFAFDNAVSTDNSCLQSKININLTHFKSDFATNDTDHLSSEPFVAAPETPTMGTTPPIQSPITPKQVIQTFLDRLSAA